MTTYHALPWLISAHFVNSTAIPFGIGAVWHNNEVRVLGLIHRATVNHQKRYCNEAMDILGLGRFPTVSLCWKEAWIRDSIAPVTAYACIHKSYCLRVFLPT